MIFLHEWVIIPLAFILGFSLGRVATCTYASTDRWINLGKGDWLFGLLIVASWAAVTQTLLIIFYPDVHTPNDLVLNPQLFLGAILMGVGATVNRGCFIGTVGNIGTGKFSYILSFVGLATALWLTKHGGLNLFEPAQPITEPIFADSFLEWLGLFGFAAIVLFSIWLIVTTRKPAYLALSAVGITASIIYCTRPDWAYSSQLNSAIAGKGLADGGTVEIAVAAMFAGALISSWLKQRFKPQIGSWPVALAKFSGGFLMGIGASAVPGGNDVLLLWSIPGLTLYGLLAYLTMIATIALGLKLSQVGGRMMAAERPFKRP